MFFYLLRIPPSKALPYLKAVALGVLGDEPRNKGLGIKDLKTKHWLTKDSEQELGQSLFAYRKIILAILWPPKLLELGLTYLFAMLDQACLLGRKEREEEQEEQESKENNFLHPGFSTRVGLGDSLRFIGRLIVFVTVGLAIPLVKYIASPYNQLIKPLFRHVEIGIQEWRKGNELLDIAQKRRESLAQDHDTHQLTAQANKFAQQGHWLKFQGAWEIAKTVLLVAAGLTAIGFMVAAIFFSSGAALPLLALIKPAMASVATFLGGSAIATSVVEALTLVVAFVASQIVMQKLLAIPAYITDIWMGLTGQRGYDSNWRVIRELVTRGTNEETHDTFLANEETHDTFLESTALFFLAFNDELVVSADDKAKEAEEPDYDYGGDKEIAWPQFGNDLSGAQVQPPATNGSALSGNPASLVANIGGGGVSSKQSGGNEKEGVAHTPSDPTAKLGVT